MNKTIRIAGFGGQGVMLIGQILAYTAMKKGYQSTFVPTYGPETRGGTANCMVSISDEEICSPVFDNAMDLICLNEPSYVKFHDKATDIILFNETLVKNVNEDQRHVSIPASLLSRTIDERSLNMVMLGAYLKKTNLLSLNDIKESLRYFFTGPKASLVEQNYQAVIKGFEYK